MATSPKSKSSQLLDLLNTYSPGKSSDLDQSELSNMYIETTQSLGQVGAEYKSVAYSLPGLALFCDTGEAVIRAFYEQNEIAYVVAGNKFGSISSLGVFTQIGVNLSTSTGFAKILAITGGSDINNQIIIIDGTHGYHYNITTAVATFPIADVDFPQTATDLTVQDDYFIVEKAGSISFYLSDISDGTSWQSLEFASKFRKPDRLVAINSNKGELWLLGSKTIEVWNNTGNASFPFERRNDVFLEAGCAAKESVVILANSMFFLAKNRTGGYSAVMIENYNLKPVSSSSIEYQFGQLTRVSDCKAIAYSKDGHGFIDFTFPTDNKTFTYDVTNGVWINHQSLVSASYGRALANCSAFCYGKNLIGDFNSGKVYSLSSTTYTEDGTAIRRRFISPPVYVNGRRVYIHRLQIDVQTNVGSNKTFTLEQSLDRGNTWDTVDTYTIPTTGDGTIYTTSLGSSFCHLFRISTTDDFNFSLLGFQAMVSLGEH